MRKLLKSIFIVLILCPSVHYGQTELEAEQVEVVKDFEVNIVSGQKSAFAPEVIDIPKSNRNFIYDLSLNPLQIDYPAPYIRPLAMYQEPIPKYKNGYIKGGLGTLNNIFGEAGFNKSITNYYDIGALLSYEQLDDNKVFNKAYKNYAGTLFTNYFLTNSKELKIRLHGDVTDRHLFGFNDLIQADTTNAAIRKISQYGASVSLANNGLGEDELAYDLGLDFDYIKANDIPMRENNIALTGKIIKPVGSKSKFSLTAGTDLTFFKSDTTETLHQIEVAPQLLVFTQSFHLDLGGSVIWQNGKANPFPRVQIKIPIKPSGLTARIGVSGDLDKNNLSALLNFNPFLNTPPSPLTSAKYYKAYAGVSGKHSELLTYDLEAGYKIIENQFTFLNNTDNTKLFDVSFSDVNVFYVSALFNFSINENIETGFVYNQSFFSKSDTFEPWHLPRLEANPYLILRALDQKLTFKTDLFIRDQLSYLNVIDGLADKSNAQVDLNFEINYAVIHQVKVFAQAMNVLNSRYERWHGYNNFGMMIRGGVMVNF